MRTEEQAHAYIKLHYNRPDFCFLEDADTQRFTARFVAIRCPKRWWNSGAHYRIHEVRPDGRWGQRVEVMEFLEVRHVGA